MNKYQHCLLGTVALCLPIAWSPLAQAGGIFVALNGNDSNPGTLSQPVASIQVAIDRARGGDTVYVRRGTYKLTERIEINQDASPNTRLVFRNYGKEEVILDGTRIQGDYPDVISVAGNNIDVQGFRVKNSPNFGIITYQANNVKILNNEVQNTQEGGIVTFYSTNVLIQNNKVSATNLEYKNTNRTEGWAQGIGSSFSQGITILKNMVGKNYGEGIGCYGSSGCVLKKNVVKDNFSVGIYLDNATQSCVAKNYISSTGDVNFYRNGDPASGIQLANEDYSNDNNPSTNNNPLNENVIVNNIVVKGKYGFAYFSEYGLGGGLKNTWVFHNTFDRASEAVFRVDKDAGNINSRFFNNIFIQTPGGTMDNVPNNNGFTFRNNLWFGATPTNIVKGFEDIFANPLFLNPNGQSAVDYKLKSSSPAIGKGATLSEVTQDYFDGRRPVGNFYDIGAHESLNGTAKQQKPSKLNRAQSTRQKGLRSLKVQRSSNIAEQRRLRSQEVRKNSKIAQRRRVRLQKSNPRIAARLAQQLKDCGS
jgi:parallel beta-helix repeat protein